MFESVFKVLHTNVDILFHNYQQKGIWMMSKLTLLLITGMTSFVWGSQEVTVQAISAVHEKSITHEFDAKLKKSGLEVHKKIENGRYVVTLGAYNNEKVAQPALKKTRLVVAKDAFIRPVNRNQTADMNHTNAVIHTTAQEHPAVVAAVETPKVIEAPKAAETPKITETLKAAEVPKTVASPIIPVVVQEMKKPAAAILSECDKKELRKDAFTEAINYYKTSPYHRFERVGIRQ